MMHPSIRGKRPRTRRPHGEPVTSAKMAPLPTSAPIPGGMPSNPMGNPMGMKKGGVVRKPKEGSAAEERGESKAFEAKEDQKYAKGGAVRGTGAAVRGIKFNVGSC